MSPRSSFLAVVVVVSILVSFGCSSADASPVADAADSAVSGDAGVDALGDNAFPDDGPIDVVDTAREAAVDEGSDTPPPTYLNPVFDVDFPDPFVLRVGATYFAYATNAGPRNIQVARSDDLAHWTMVGDALPKLPAWAAPNAGLTWAPTVLPRGAGYVLYYTARYTAAGIQCVSRATASAPEGPYVDDSTAPFVCQTALCGSIDPSPFVDDDGSAWLVWKSDENASACASDSRLWVQPLTDDGRAVTGDPTILLARDRGWETPLVEGPDLRKVGGRYYLFYSAGDWASTGYGIGYAVCDSPRGPCTKKSLTGPWVGSIDPILGPGGEETFLDSSGDPWMAYHAWTSPRVGYDEGGARSLRIDRIDFSSGSPVLTGPSVTPQPL